MENKTRSEKSDISSVIFPRLSAAYPTAHCALNHTNPRELLIATILSAQCTDKRVNMVTPGLFQKYPTAQAFADADLEELKNDIRSTGFFNNKAKAIKSAMKSVSDKFGGEIPRTMEELLQLEGVGRKTANVVLGDAFGVPGIVVDTHVKRLANLLGLTKNADPEKIEQDLMKQFPKEQWTMLGHLLIEHGRVVCIARRPQCGQCVLNDICPSA
ncbi:MAG: endonuclease III [Candidatus Marinimicrobia bacterium CG08_land_8_20_14_0_20_45_22]|nr:MAG: endonuclease III [Candidatus Marinimicrobia bacterium CG08_land_8_20_14_0_20_45_22]